jgi:hypothetical protein
MNPSEKVRTSFSSSIVTVSMPESSNAEKSNSSKRFGRKSDFRAEHPEKASDSIFFREDDREIPIEDNFLQPQKASERRTATESGSENSTSDTQPWNA